MTKKEFVEQILQTDEAASLRDIQAAWQSAGNTDTISSSLVYKTKSEMKSKGAITGRRSRGARRGQARGSSTGASTSSHAPQSAGEDIHAEVRRAAFSILSRDGNEAGLTIADITEAIETENLVAIEEDTDLPKILAAEIRALREEGLAERGENRLIRKVKGAKLD